MLLALLSILIYISASFAQTLPDPRRCVAGSGITSFAACEWWYDTFSTCSAYAAASQPRRYHNCYCQQRMFNAIWNCDSEQRLCLGRPDVDVDFEGPLSIWHSECDPMLNYSLTTPVLSSITASYNINVCPSIRSTCASLTAERSACTNTWTPGQYAALTSCLCKPPLLSLAYGCSVLGNVSCEQVPAALTGMAEYGHCSNLDAVLTIPNSVTATLGSSTDLRVTYYTPTISAGRSSNTELFPGHKSSIGSSNPAATSPTSNMGVPLVRLCRSWAWPLIVVLYCLLWNV